MVVMVFMDGCAPAAPQATPASPTTTPSPAATLPSTAPISTIQPTTAITAASPCIPIEESAPAGLPLSGVWVRNEFIPYLEDTLTQADIRIPLKGGGMFARWSGDAAVSPDRKHLAYIDQYYDPVITYRPVKRILRVISSSGDSLELGYWKEDWQYIIGWVDNRTIALFTSARNVAKLNPFSGTWDSLPEPAWLVNMGYTGDKYGFHISGAPLFAPTADRIIVEAENGGFDVRDLRSGDLQFHGSGRYYYPLDWSADGSTFAYIAPDHLMVVRQARPVADLNLVEAGAAFDWYGVLKLSPDGQKAAFIGESWYPDERGPRLFVYDEARSRLYRLCDDSLTLEGSWPISWSPDGRFLVAPIVEGTDPWSWPVLEFDVLLDTQALRAFKLVSGQQQHRLLWLAAP